MQTQEKFNEVRTEMLDCIHLKACRRLQKIARNYYKQEIGRKCDDKCTAYENIEGLIEHDAKYAKTLPKAAIMYDLLRESSDTISDALSLVSDKIALNELLALYDLINEVLQDIQYDGKEE